MLDDPGFLAWKAGERLDPEDRAWWGGWHDAVHDAVARGVVVRRLRIITEPITDYVRYEFDGTFTNLAAGEDVRWLPRDRSTDITMPETDFWLFDNATALFHHFTDEGQLKENGREYTEDPSRVAECRSAFESAWLRAIPHKDYRP